MRKRRGKPTKKATKTKPCLAEQKNDDEGIKLRPLSPVDGQDK